jgi:hypothetical protein
MANRFTDAHRQRQTLTLYTYEVTYFVAGRAVSWQAQVMRGGKRWHLCGAGIELPEEHAETGLGMSAREIVRLDVNRAIDGLG